MADPGAELRSVHTLYMWIYSQPADHPLHRYRWERLLQESPERAEDVLYLHGLTMEWEAARRKSLRRR